MLFIYIYVIHSMRDHGSNKRLIQYLRDLDLGEHFITQNIPNGTTETLHPLTLILHQQLVH